MYSLYFCVLNVREGVEDVEENGYVFVQFIYYLIRELCLLCTLLFILLFDSCGYRQNRRVMRRKRGSARKKINKQITTRWKDNCYEYLSRVKLKYIFTETNKANEWMNEWMKTTNKQNKSSNKWTNITYNYLSYLQDGFMV